MLRVARLAIVIILYNLMIYQCHGKLVYVLELFRHGARAPLRNLLYEDWVDEIGIGELTGVGIRQHYILGLQMKETYKDLLPVNYTSSAVRIMSSTKNRTIQSALSHANGLFSPKIITDSSTQDPEELISNFSPFPIHSNMLVDYVFRPFDCTNVLSSEKRKENLLQYNALFKPEDFAELNKLFNISDYFGIDDISIYEYGKSYDALITNLYAGEKILIEPKSRLWNVSQAMHHIADIKKIEDESSYIGTPLFEKILQLLGDKVSSPTSQRVFDILSGHDTNLYIFFQAFGKSSTKCAVENFKKYGYIQTEKIDSCITDLEFAASINFELHETTSNDGTAQYSVKTLYNMKEIKLCEEIDGIVGCKWESFVKLLQSKINNDFGSKCGKILGEYSFPEVVQKRKTIFSILLGSFVVTSIIFILIFIYYYRTKSSLQKLVGSYKTLNYELTNPPEAIQTITQALPCIFSRITV